jgi:PD-(D/E)XK nuclease superfamily
MADLKNELTFSASREKQLDRCALLVFRQSYQSWGGWWRGQRPPDTPTAEEAYKLKNAESAASYSGKLVHEAAAWTLKATMEGRKFELIQLRNTLMQRAAEQLDATIKRTREGGVRDPKRNPVLYDFTDDREEWLRERTRDRIIALTADGDAWSGDLSAFNPFTSAIQRREKIAAVEQTVSFTVAGVKVFLQIDAMLIGKSRDANDRHVVIIDWKTGRPKIEDREQVELYGFYTRSKQWNRVTAVLAYLNDGGTGETTLVPEQDDWESVVTARVERFRERMASMLADGDLVKNVPIRDRFTPTSDHRNCVACPFKGMCVRDKIEPALRAQQETA